MGQGASPELEVAQMENNNDQSQQVSTQPVNESTQPKSEINPMKAVSAPQMPTLLKFAQQQSLNTEDKKESEK